MLSWNSSIKAVKVRYFVPREEKRYRCTPPHYVYSSCYFQMKEDIPYCARKGDEGYYFPFPDGKCSNFLGEYEAEIIEEIKDVAKFHERDVIKFPGADLQ